MRRLRNRSHDAGHHRLGRVPHTHRAAERVGIAEQPAGKLLRDDRAPRLGECEPRVARHERQVEQAEELGIDRHSMRAHGAITGRERYFVAELDRARDLFDRRILDLQVFGRGYRARRVFHERQAAVQDLDGRGEHGDTIRVREGSLGALQQRHERICAYEAGEAERQRDDVDGGRHRRAPQIPQREREVVSE
ncbi:MAG TPA: hypothetical protein VFO94_16710, partial [Gammaproteobacteria bacterium]|nr:hypothetical protein [Gammaproteobacteria bacterium]